MARVTTESTAPKVEPRISKVTLEMTPVEAEALVVVLCKVGGTPDGPRGHINQILNALDKAGIKWANSKLYGQLIESRHGLEYDAKATPKTFREINEYGFNW